MLVCGLVGFEAQRNDKRREMAQTEGDRRVHWLANYFIFRSAWNIERFFFFMSAHVCLLLSLSFHTVCHFTMLPRSSFFHAKHICSSFLISVSAALMCNMFSDSNKRNVYNISNNCVCKYHACLYCPIMFLNSITNFCFTIIHFFFSIFMLHGQQWTLLLALHVWFNMTEICIEAGMCRLLLLISIFQNSTKLFWTLV